jgi:hypothetical protein
VHRRPHRAAQGATPEVRSGRIGRSRASRADRPPSTPRQRGRGRGRLRTLMVSFAPRRVSVRAGVRGGTQPPVRAREARTAAELLRLCTFRSRTGRRACTGCRRSRARVVCSACTSRSHRRRRRCRRCRRPVHGGPGGSNWQLRRAVSRAAAVPGSSPLLSGLDDAVAATGEPEQLCWQPSRRRVAVVTFLRRRRERRSRMRLMRAMSQRPPTGRATPR